MDWRLLVLVALLGFGLGSWLAWVWQANSYDKQLADQAASHATDREAAAAAAIDRLEFEQTERRALENRLQAIDETHYKELRDEQQAQARLRDRLATADVRLSVVLANPTEGRDCGLSAATGPAGVDHGSKRAELDPAHARRIVSITQDGDQGLIALKACQAYVKNVGR